MARLHTHSQHFLKNPAVVERFIHKLNLSEHDTVVDLGAGSGVISAAVSKEVKQVIALEIEPHTLKTLKENMALRPNVSVIDKDILTFTPPKDGYKIVANIPFSISSAVVTRFTEEVAPPRSMHLILQKQFARKLVPGTDHFTSLLSAKIGPWFTVRIIHELDKNDYTPPPAVDTVLVEITPRKTPLITLTEAEKYRAFVTRCFERQKFFATLPREAAGISAELRPSQLSLSQWQRLFEVVSQKPHRSKPGKSRRK